MQKKLPGSLSKNQLIDQILRVNYAGEYGAKRIYEGQLSILKSEKSSKVIRHMKSQEIVHMNYFQQQIIERHTRPSILYPLWHVGGFALGAFSAILGPKYAFACTVAVEEVIVEHYHNQLAQIDQDEPELATKIRQFRNEEIEHHDISIAHKAEDAPFFKLFSQTIKIGCKLAIMLAKRY
jgi:ubiquinone biosynthesis monooxygenase Coq7